MVGKKDFSFKQQMPAMIGLVDLSLKYQQFHKDINEYCVDGMKFVSKYFPEITDMAVYLFSDSDGQFNVAMDKINNRKLASTELFRLANGFAWDTYFTGYSKILVAMNEDPEITYKENLINGTGSYYCFPIEQSNYKRVGAVAMYSSNPYLFDEHICIIMGKFAQALGNALESYYLMKEAVERSFHDELTGVYNRRFFNEQYEHEVFRHRRYNIQYGILMMDIDHFKKFNDSFGHAAGDQVLKVLARTITASTRKTDIVARYGGEEFIVLLPDTTKENTIIVAEKIRKNVEAIYDAKLPNLSFLEKPVTISLGVASFPSDSVEKQELIERADVNLYKAKTGGRNQVVSS